MNFWIQRQYFGDKKSYWIFTGDKITIFSRAFHFVLTKICGVSCRLSARRTKSRGMKGLQLEGGAGMAFRLLVSHSCVGEFDRLELIEICWTELRDDIQKKKNWFKWALPVKLRPPPHLA